MSYGTCRICGTPGGPRPKGLTRGLCGPCYQRFMYNGFESAPPLRGMELFWSKVEKSDGCWIWTSTISCYGYGQFGGQHPFGTAFAHRIAYMDIRGRFDAELTLDHLCHNEDPDCDGGNDCLHRRCVNPDHLEPVTSAVNTMRGNAPTAQNARRSNCGTCGGPYDAERVNGRRRCTPCFKVLQAAAYQRKKAKPLSA